MAPASSPSSVSASVRRVLAVLRWSCVLAAPACSLAFQTEFLSEGCSNGLKTCSGQCVAWDDPLWGCADLSCNPCFEKDRVMGCSKSGECVPLGCAGTLGSCGGPPCAVDFAVDAENCGGCGVVCDGPLEHGSWGCANQVCVVGECHEGYADCDADPDNGCEQRILDDPDACGDCWNQCAEGESCVDGLCV
jgi:hypothetical protein